MTIRTLMESSQMGLEDLTCVETRIVQIFQSVNDNQNTSHLSGIEDLHLAELSENKSITQSDLALCYNNLKDNKKISACPFNAFILSSYAIPADKLEKANIIQARLIVEAHNLAQLENYEVIINRALDSCRIIFTAPRYSKHFELLPDFMSSNEDLIQELTCLNQRLPLKSYHILNFKSFFEKCEKKIPKYHPRHVVRPSNNHVSHDPMPGFTIAPDPVQLDKDEPNVTEYIANPETPAPTELEPAEFKIEQLPQSKYFSIALIAPESVNQALTLQRNQATAIASYQLKRRKRLTFEYRQLTQYDVTSLVSHWQKELTVREFGLLIICLLTGRSLSEIYENRDSLKVGSKEPFKDIPVLMTNPGLPEHRCDASLEPLLTRSRGQILIALPTQLKNSVLWLKNASYDLAEVQQQIELKLKSLNKRYKTRLTYPRVVNFLADYLTQKGIDSAQIALITGKGILQEPSCYYFQTCVSQLLRLHQSFMMDVFQSSNPSFVPIIDQSSDLLVGSQLQLKADKIKTLFACLKNELLHMRNSRGIRTIEHFHNLYTIYIIYMLNLATGHRPVKSPYDTLASFDTLSATVIISDKESHNVYSPRVLPLPQIANEQIVMYIQHLSNIRPALTNISPELGRYIESSIDETAPAFFFIDKSNWIEVTPSTLDNFTSKILPIRLNWHRHFMRTWLIKQSIHGHVVDGWMGHSSVTGDSRSKFSALGMKDLKLVAQEINDFFLKFLELTAEEPWRN